MSDLTNAQNDANVAQTDAGTALAKAQTVRQLVDAWYTRESVRDAVVADDFALLVPDPTRSDYLAHDTEETP